MNRNTAIWEVYLYQKLTNALKQSFEKNRRNSQVYDYSFQIDALNLLAFFVLLLLGNSTSQVNTNSFSWLLYHIDL